MKAPELSTNYAKGMDLKERFERFQRDIDNFYAYV